MEKSLIACKNCGNQFSGKYCSHCGEKVYGEHDRSVLHFLEEVFHFATHFEGALLTTIKTFILHPGKVSDDYCFGIRKKYFKPISLYLLLVVLYLLFPKFEGLNMRLQFYERQPVYGQFAGQKIKSVMQKTGMSFAQLEEVFRAKSEKTSKFLLPVLIPLTALFFWLLTFRRRKYFFDQIIFATEANCIFLLWGFLAFPVLLLLADYVNYSINHTHLRPAERIVAILVYLGACIFVAVGSRRFYKLSYPQSIAFALLFGAVQVFNVTVPYKFLSFIITISQIH
ncbi:DUF3667 domain-containing protein [Dyadobacter arcticus]|uniref:DUF3667 domain-containing protein n=1 Tax=Dyadobacter arcticus TaxID=1078754 RepID=A0ABX0UQZ4_9BACT|nr:DUF3667 domain-containing protein [Dyadobacter arcticus]NIJ55414.1 hypothetical protein [Dyadobacter arcticus]